MSSQRGSYIDQNFGVSEVTFTSVLQGNPKRNMMEAFDEPDRIKVYVRLRTQDQAEKTSRPIMEVRGSKIVMHPPTDSQTFKNLEVGGPKHKIHHLTFNKIFMEDTSQKDLFEGTVIGPVTEFIKGSNALVFTYGATSAGKTYTMQGTNQNIGILPRSIDVIFNSLGPYLMQEITVKPERQSGMRLLSIEERRDEMRFSAALLKSAEEPRTKYNSIGGPLTAKRRLQSTSSEVTDVSHRSRDSGSVVVTNGNRYSVWISCVEIYNEQIYDLLSLERNKGQNVVPLKLAEESKGCFYIKGVKEAHVKNADEAYKVLLIGQRNLHFAATSLNHNSSRSHSIFQIRIVRLSQDGNPEGIQQIAFCDLAGAERTAKAQSHGERLQEACSINLSLSTLHHVIEALRQNAKTNRPKSLVRIRESKLTSLLHTYFTGTSQTVMVVNVSQNPKLFDETLHVLKFAALAQEVELPRRQLMAPTIKNKRVSSIIEKRRSSMMTFDPAMNSTARPSIASAALFDLTEQDEDDVTETPDDLTQIVEEDEDDADDTEVPDTDDVEILKNHIRSLKKELEEAVDEKDEIEVQVRQAVVSECQQMMKESEKKWRERLQEMEDLAEETAERRLLQCQENSRKRGRDESVASADSAWNSKLIKMNRENEDLKVALEDLKADLANKEKEVAEAKRVASMSQAKLQTLNFSMAMKGEKTFEFGAVEVQLPFNAELSKEEMYEKLVKSHTENKEIQRNAAEYLKSLDEVVAECERLEEVNLRLVQKHNKMLKEMQQQDSELEEKEEKIAELEAVRQEYVARCEELESCDKQSKEDIATLKDDLSAKDIEISELSQVINGKKGEQELKDLEIIQLREELQHFHEVQTPRRRTPKKVAPSPFRGQDKSTERHRAVSKENLLRTPLRKASPSPNRQLDNHQLQMVTLDLKKMKDRVKALEGEKETLKAKLDNIVDNELTKVLAEKESLVEQIDSLSVELNTANVKVEGLEEERGELRANFRQMGQLNLELAKANEQLEILSTEHSDLKAELEQHKAISTNVEKLLDEKRLLTEGICSLKKDYDAVVDELEALKKASLKVEENVQVADECDLLKGRITQLTDQATELTNTLKAREEALTAIEEQRDRLQAEVEAALGKKTEVQALLTAVEAQCASHESELALLAVSKSELQSKVDSLVQAYEEKLQAAEIALKAVEEERDRLKEELYYVIGEKANMQASLRAVEAQCASHESELALLAVSKSELQSKVHSLAQANVEKLQVAERALKAVEEERDRLQAELHDVSGEKANVQASLTAVEAQLSAEIVNVSDRNSRLAKEVIDLESDLKEKNKALDDLNFKFKEVSSVLKQANEVSEKDRDKVQAELDQLIKEKQKMVAANEKQMEKMRVELLSATSKAGGDELRALKSVQEAMQAQITDNKKMLEERDLEIMKLRDLLSKTTRKFELTSDEMYFVKRVCENQTAMNTHRSVSMMPGEIAAAFMKVKEEPKSPERFESFTEEPQSEALPEAKTSLKKEDEPEESKKRGRKGKTPARQPKNDDLPPPSTGRALRARKAQNATSDDSEFALPSSSRMTSRRQESSDEDEWQPKEQPRRQMRAVDRSVSRKREVSPMTLRKETSPVPTRKASEAPKSLRKLYSATHNALECSPVPSLEHESTHDIVNKKLSRKASKK